LIFDLSPPVLYEFGLTAAFAWLVEETRKRYELAVELKERGQDRPINVETRMMVFRATRELLTNAAKHANASKVQLTAEWLPGELCVCVEDDGVGFDAPRARRQGVWEGAFGLFSIQERIEQFGGRFEIDSRSGRGTRTTLTIPLDSTPIEDRRES
jgi:signal transduction histidine kinase